MTEVQEEEVNELEDVYLDPRQKNCWRFYTDPKSPTFANGKGSAIRAGYSEYYASAITQKGWFKNYKRRYNLLQKAERAMDKALDLDTRDEEGQEQADLLRVQTDVAKFVAKTLGKDEGYSERTEMTGANGEAIVFMPAELMDKYKLQTNSGEEVTNVRS